MNIREFLETKEIKKEELDSHFNLVEQLDIDVVTSLCGCPKCKDTLNVSFFRSPSWTMCFECRACKSMFYVYVADRMGGSNTDVVFVYKEK